MKHCTYYCLITTLLMITQISNLKAEGSAKVEDQKKFVLISDPAVLAIPIIENNDKTVNLKDTKDLAYKPAPQDKEIAANYTIVRKEVYRRLLLAQSFLPKGMKLRIQGGYRSIASQKKLFDNMQHITKQQYPHLSKEERFKKATEMFSPVKNFDGSTNVPAHSTGGAVDIIITDMKGDVVALGPSQLKECLSITTSLCYIHSTSVSAAAKKNRQILFDVMTKAGFVNYFTEWWHWSYGDRYWAYVKKEPHAIYGSLPEKQFQQSSGKKVSSSLQAGTQR